MDKKIKAGWIIALFLIGARAGYAEMICDSDGNNCTETWTDSTPSIQCASDYSLVGTTCVKNCDSGSHDNGGGSCVSDNPDATPLEVASQVSYAPTNPAVTASAPTQPPSLPDSFIDSLDVEDPVSMDSSRENTEAFFISKTCAGILIGCMRACIPSSLSYYACNDGCSAAYTACQIIQPRISPRKTQK